MIKFNGDLSSALQTFFHQIPKMRYFRLPVFQCIIINVNEHKDENIFILFYRIPKGKHLKACSGSCELLQNRIQ